MLAAKTDKPFKTIVQAVDRLAGETDAAFAHRIDQVGARLRQVAQQDYDRPATRVCVSLDVGRQRALVECRLYRALLA